MPSVLPVVRSLNMDSVGALPSNTKGGSLLVEGFADPPGNAALVGDPEDQSGFAVMDNLKERNLEG